MSGSSRVPLTWGRDLRGSSARSWHNLWQITNYIFIKHGTGCYIFYVHRAAQKKLSVYKAKQFGRFARKARIRDADLWETARLVHEGSIEADLVLQLHLMDST